MSTFNELIAQIGDNPQIRAFGTKADYAPTTTHKGVLYFASDTQEILYNGDTYGFSIPKYTSSEWKAFGNNQVPDYPLVIISFEANDPNIPLNNLTEQGWDQNVVDFWFGQPREVIFFRCFSDPRQICYQTLKTPNAVRGGETSISIINRDFSIKLLSDYTPAKDLVLENIRSFLEATDPGNTTINKWKELEAFLAGITDTQTLTKLLQDVQTAAAADAAAKVKAVQDAFDEYKTQMNTVLEDIYRIIGT